MMRYRLVATDSFGQFRFAATLWCVDDTAALRRFAGLPLGGNQAWLSRGRVRLAFRAAEAPRRGSRPGRVEARPATALGKAAGATGEDLGAGGPLSRRRDRPQRPGEPLQAGSEPV